MQRWRTLFPIWNQSVVPYPVLTVASWPAYRIIRRQVRWSGVSIFKNFLQFIVIHIVKGFVVVHKVEVAQIIIQGFPSGASGKELICQCRGRKRCEFNPWIWKICWRRAWQSTTIFLPGESHGQRNLMGCSPWIANSQTWLKPFGHVHVSKNTRRCFMGS